MSTRPLTLTIAAAVVGLEGLTAVVLGAYVAVETLVGSPSDLNSSIAVAVFGVIAGAGLLWVGWGALRMERWCRSPGVITQILALPIGGTLIQSDVLVAGIALIVVSIAGLIALLAPTTTQALYDEERVDGERVDRER